MTPLVLLRYLLAPCLLWAALGGGVCRAQYPECQSGDCQEGTGTLRVAEGNVYTGTFRGGKRHGQGRFVWANGDVYVGAWANDGIQGWGTLTAADGRTYIGQFANGLMQGQGTFTWPVGHTYTGEWFAGAPHGQGRMLWADGTEYSGTFVEGKPHGHDTVVWGNGSVYVGEIRQGELHGQGVFVWGPRVSTPGAVFVGRWARNERTGPGTLTTPDSSYVLVATYQHNQPHGPDCRARWRAVQDSTPVWAEYAGGAAAGRWDGLGTLRTWCLGPSADTLPTGLYHGRWRAGRPEGPGVLENLPLAAVVQGNAPLPDSLAQASLLYVGEWRGGWFEGQGVLRLLLPNGTPLETQTGTFYRNQLNGLGSVEWPNAERFQGLLQACRFQGPGRYSFADGSYIEGPWRNNAPEPGASAYSNTDYPRPLPELAQQTRRPFPVSAAFIYPLPPHFPAFTTPPLPPMPKWQ